MDFIKRLGEVHAKVGVPRAFTAIDKLAEVLSGGDVGRYSPTIQRLLQVYTESRGRTESVEDVLSGTGIKSADRPSSGKRDISSDNKPDGKRTVAKEYLDREQVDESLPIQGRVRQQFKSNLAEEIWNLPRGMMAVDLPFITSAAFRQASPLAWTSAWYKSWIPSIKAYGEEAMYLASENEIRESKYFRPRYEPKYNKKGEIVGYKEAPSVAEEAGVRLADLDDLSGREEHIRATLAEKIPIYGRHIRASNRGYVSFLNTTRRFKFEAMMNQAEFVGVENDVAVMKQIGEFLNDATGRSSLKIKVGTKELNFEVGSRGLALALWSPRLLASRMRMLNPFTYYKMDKRVRKEYMKGLLRAGANWWGFVGLALLAKEALGIDVEVGLDWTSSDFGKVRIGFGDTRIDTGAGFQQFLVAVARFATNKSTSAGSGKVTEFGEGFRPRTRKSLTEDFAASKLHPNAKLAYDLLNVSNDRPVHIWDRVMQNAIPLVAQDIFEIMEEEPGLALALAPLISGGVGANTFGANKRFGDPVFTDSIEDYLDMDRRSLSGTVRKW